MQNNNKNITVKKKQNVPIVLFRGHKWYPDAQIDAGVDGFQLCKQLAAKQHHSLVVRCENNAGDTIYSSFVSQSSFHRMYKNSSKFQFEEVLLPNSSRNCYFVLKIPSHLNDRKSVILKSFSELFGVCLNSLFLRTPLKFKYEQWKLSIRKISSDKYIAVYPLQLPNQSELEHIWKYLQYHLNTLYLRQERSHRDNLIYFETENGSLYRRDIIQFDPDVSTAPINTLRNSLFVTGTKDSVVLPQDCLPSVLEITPTNQSEYLINNKLDEGRFIMCIRDCNIDIDNSISMSEQLADNRINISSCNCKFTGSPHYDDYDAYHYLSVSYDGFLQYKCSAKNCKKRVKMYGSGLFRTQHTDKYPAVTVETAQAQADKWYDEVIMGLNEQYAGFNQLDSELRHRADGIVEVFSDIFKDRIKITSSSPPVSYLWNGTIWVKDDRFLLSKIVTKAMRSIMFKAVRWHQAVHDQFEPRDPQAKKIRRYIACYVNMIDKINDGNTTNILRGLCEKFWAPDFDESINHHPYKLVSKDGMVDLKSGRLISPLPEDNLTIESKYQYYECSCPLGECGMFGINCDSKCNIGFINKTIKTMMRDDDELYNHTRWCIGYSLCGDPKKKLGFVGFGNKYNGKSLLSNLIIDVVPMYAKAMEKGVVIKARMSQTPGAATEHLVHLNGIRLAVLNETGENDSINEEELKAITGRDKKPVRANFGHQFDMDMEFAPFICTNHKPKISITDEAMWERLCPLVFPVSFLRDPDPNNPNERKADEDLARKFRMHVNLERMYNFLVRCCLYYVQNQDKSFPDEIKEEIRKYKQECNMVIEFIEENKDRYAVEVNAEIEQGDFIKALSEWCKNRNIRQPNLKKVSKMLEHLKCEIKPSRNRIVGLKSIQPILIDNGGNSGSIM